METQKLYLLMHAAHKNCVACVEYWICNGVDAEQKSVHSGYSAMDWAEWGKVHEALAVLQAECGMEPVRNLWEAAVTGDVQTVCYWLYVECGGAP